MKVDAHRLEKVGCIVLSVAQDAYHQVVRCDKQRVVATNFFAAISDDLFYFLGEWIVHSQCFRVVLLSNCKEYARRNRCQFVSQMCHQTIGVLLQGCFRAVQRRNHFSFFKKFFSFSKKFFPFFISPYSLSKRFLLFLCLDSATLMQASCCSRCSIGSS